MSKARKRLHDSDEEVVSAALTLANSLVKVGYCNKPGSCYAYLANRQDIYPRRSITTCSPSS